MYRNFKEYINLVVARVKSNLRRFSYQSLCENDVQTKKIHLDPINKQVKMDQKAIDLTPCEFTIFQQLFSRPGLVFSREQLMEQIDESSDSLNLERRIDYHVKNLRKKFERYLNDRDINQTVYGAGYKLVI